MKKREVFLAAAIVASCAAVSWAGGATASAPAAEIQSDDRKNLCFMDGKANSLGAVVSADGKAYRCSAVLLERGVRGVAWVAVRQAAVIAE